MQSKLWMPFLLICSFFCGLWFHQTTNATAEQPVEKWGRIAYTAFQDEYEGAKLKDYHYIGRTKVNEEQTKDVFRVTIDRGSKPFAAHAEIYFHPVTGHLISINVFRL
ncbi:YqzG/YhdC family protein [Bacillus sp. NPDC077027]|uniref:YqzG/YhdC family protein n=1 Tax=Bacillus sp. NPDC077027 TaxID=3390548 RepID=UPI003D008076